MVSQTRSHIQVLHPRWFFPFNTSDDSSCSSHLELATGCLTCSHLQFEIYRPLVVELRGSAEKLVEFHSDIVKTVSAKYPKHPLILAGKSMGSRVSCVVAAENGIRASAVVCFGYPLKGSKGTIRDKPLLQVIVPTMFVQGTKDGLCPLESIEVVRKKMKAYNKVHVVENGEHSIKIGKTNLKWAGITQEEAEQSAVQAIAMFVSQTVGAK